MSDHRIGLDQLRKLGDAFKQIDQELRAGSICQTCGKPTDGIVPGGKTKAEVGLCTCQAPIVDGVTLDKTCEWCGSLTDQLETHRSGDRICPDCVENDIQLDLEIEAELEENDQIRRAENQVAFYQLFPGERPENWTPDPPWDQ